jgi:hypothetical protein
MKIPSDNIAQSMLKPLDSDAAALDSARLTLDRLSDAIPGGELDRVRADASGPSRDPGESLLASDVWNGAADSARRLDTSAASIVQPDNSAALDQTVDTILAGLR